MANKSTAIKFDGTDDILIIEDTTIGDFADDKNPGPFTMEAWIKVEGHSGGSASDRQVIASKRASGESSSTNGGWFWDIQSSRMQFGGYFGAAGWEHGGGTDHVDCTYPTDSEWHHVVVQRIGDANSVRQAYAVFLDGILEELKQKDGTGGNFLRGQDGDKMCLGNNAYNNEADCDFDGYIDEFRISHIARYGEIEVPTTQLKTWQTAGRGHNALLSHHTKLLIQANSSTTTSSAIVDESGNHAVIVSDGAAHSQGKTNFGNTAIYFDGSNDELQVVDHADWHFETGDFSVEFWANDTGGSTAHGYIGVWISGQKGWGIWYNDASSGKIQFVYSTDGTGQTTIDFGATSIVSDNTWHHFVACRNNGVFAGYIDGQLVTGTPLTANFHNSTRYLEVGANSGAAGWFQGYMDGIRICKGQSAYTPNFVPYGSQKNIVHGRGGAITDARHPSANTHAIRMGQEAIGSTPATNANTYCLDFDGSADYLHRNFVTDWNSADDRGTIFAWIYIDSAAVNTIFSSGGGNVITNGDFEIGIEGWTGAGYETLSNESSGQSGNCLGITRVSDSYQYVHQSFPTVSGVAYTFSAYVKTGSGTDVGYNIYVGTAPGNNSLSGSNTGTASSSWVQVTDTFTATGNYAVISLVRGASTAAGRMDFDTVRCYPTDERRFQVLVDASSKLGIHQENNDTVDDLYTAGSVATAGWHSVAIVSSGTAYTAYIDGVASSLSATTGTSSGDWLSDTINRNNLFIGAHNDKNTSGAPANLFNGKIMQVAYWGGASGTTGVLDADAIAALHAAGKGYDIKGSGNTGNYDSWADDLKGYWRMGNHYLDTAETIHDASGNGYDMHHVSNPPALTWSTGTSFLTNWQDRGYFTPDKYTALLIQSSTHEGSTTFTDSGPGFKRVEFDGSADYLNVNTASPNQYRKNDVTGSISFWTKWGGITGGTGDNIFGAFQSSDYFYFYIRANDIYIDYRDDGTDNSRTDGPTASGITQGEWSHIVFTQSGEAGDDVPFKVYINGDYVAWNPTRINKPLHQVWFKEFAATNFIIGGWLNTGGTFSDPYKGQISQFAVWGGSSVGTSGAVLSASDVAAIYALGPNGNVKTSYSTGLVDYWTMGNLIGEGTDTSSTIYSQVSGGVDLTATSMAAPFTGHTLTRHAQAEHKTDESVFGGSSIYFPASPAAKCLTVASSSDWALGPGDWTLELWVRPYDISGNECYLAHGTSSGPHTRWYFIQEDGGQLYFDYYTGGTNTVRIQSGEILKAQRWQHVALIHDSTAGQNGNKDYLLYCDGKLVKTLDDDSDVGSTSGDLHIGTNTASSGAEDPYKGHIDEIRISSIARYTYPIERYANTWVEKGDTGDAFTALQIQSNGAKSGKPYSDALNRSGYNTGLVTISGNPTWVTTVGDPFGGANTALYFGGELDTISFADSAEWDLVGASLTNWTHEVWVYHDQDVAYGSYIGQYEDASNKWFFGANGYAWGQLYSGSVTNWTISNTAVKVPSYEWVHMVFQRKNGHYEQYMNGVLIATQGTYANDTYSGVLKIGDAGDPSWNAFVGYMDQIRLSVGIARYGNFSLRTAQQVITSSNSDSQVVTSNSTFGTGDYAFTTDSYTAIIINGDENWGGTTSATLSVGGTGPGPVSSGTVTLTNNSTATQRRGISAFGANSYFIDGTDTDEGLYVQMSNNTALANLHSFTVEGWYKQTFQANKFLWAAQYDSTDAWDYDMIGSYHESAILLRTNWDVSGTASNYVNVSTTAHADDEWHHFAWQYDFTTLPYPTVTTLIDGEVMDRSSISAMTTGNKDYKNGKFWIGNGGDIVRAMTGFIDSWRFSANILRYGYTGTNVKNGLNAVHPSHCKLLITSNTYSRNTHFDDLSDQGNFWNQQPYNYSFTRAPYLKNVNAGNLAKSIMDSDVAGSIAAWVMIRPGATMSQKTIISFTDTGVTTQYFQFDVNEHASGLHCLSIGEVYNGSPQSNILGTSVGIEEGIWYLAGCVSTGTAYKLYLNGIDIGGTTSGTQGDWIADCNADGDMDNVNVGELMRSSGGGEWDGGIAQVAVWGNTSDTAQGGAGVLSTAQFQAMFEAGPTANWTTDYQTNMRLYYTMGNHNSLGGRGADTGDICYDRAGHDIDLTIGDGNAIYAPHKGSKLLIPSGTVRHETDVKNFGSSAIYFDGNSDYLTASPSTDFNITGTTADFTVECWVYSRIVLSGTDSATILGNGGEGTSNNNGWNFQYYQGGFQPTLSGASGGTSQYSWSWGTKMLYATTIQAGTWYHLAWTRSQGVFTNWINGIPGGVVTDQTGAYVSVTSTLEIGRNKHGDRYWNGYMDEIAIYKGVCKYNAVALPGQATMTPNYLSDPTGNHFTTSALAVTDQMLDRPENNFNTFNPLSERSSYSGTGTLTEGNLSLNGTPHTTSWGAKLGTHRLTTGKWYYEFDAGAWTNGGGSGHAVYAGFYDIAKSGEPNGKNSQNPQNESGGHAIVLNNTEVQYINSGTSGPADTGQPSEPTIGVLIDIDNATFEARINGVTFKTVQNITLASKPELVAFAGQSDAGTITF